MLEYNERLFILFSYFIYLFTIFMLFFISAVASQHFWDSSPKRICLSHFVSKDMTPNWMSHFKAWLDFLEEPISQCSHDRTDRLCGLSFVKVIQIRQTLHKLCIRLLVLLNLKQSGISSLVFSSLLKSNTLFLVYFSGSHQAQGQLNLSEVKCWSFCSISFLVSAFQASRLSSGCICNV